jgi:uncharacterized membrane protein YphA (DoxX/SURF4 family)
MLVTLIILLAITFIAYGLLCLFTDHMKIEFQRYGLSHLRKLTGIIEFLGGAGLLVGLTYTPLLILSTSGLGLLMLLGVLVRLKSKDPLIQILPAFILMLISIKILFSLLSF